MTKPGQGASETGAAAAPPSDPVLRLREAMNAERQAIQDLIRENGALRRRHEQWHHATTELVHAVQSHDPTAALANENGTKSLASVAEYVRELGGRASQSFRQGETLRTENAGLVERCQELMKENNNLFKLYVASRHLHSTLVLDEVLQVISEIIQDIIGASDYAIFLHDDKTRHLVPGVIKGLDGEIPDRLPAEQLEGLDGDAGYVTEALDGDSDANANGAPRKGRPLVLIPLRNEARLLGAIAIYRLLSQKPRLTDVDHALFDFFAGHAATALFSARLFAQAEGKVEKMKAFLTMMNQ